MSNLVDAYGEPFDPRPLVAGMHEGEAAEVMELLWERLHHQGDMGSASYAAVPALVDWLQSMSRPDWSAYALIATIEEVRVVQGELPPTLLSSDYFDAWRAILPLALRDLADAGQDELVRSLIAVIAHAKGQHSLGAIALCTEDERAEMLG